MLCKLIDNLGSRHRPLFAVRVAVEVLLETTVAGLLKPIITRPLEPNGSLAKRQAAEHAAGSALTLVRELFATSTGGVRHDGAIARRLLCHLLQPLAFAWFHKVRLKGHVASLILIVSTNDDTFDVAACTEQVYLMSNSRG